MHDIINLIYSSIALVFFEEDMFVVSLAFYTKKSTLKKVGEENGVKKAYPINFKAKITLKV